MIKKILFLCTVLMFALGLQSVKAQISGGQSCSDITVTETSTDPVLSPVSTESITYQISNSNTIVTYSNFSVTINLPLGIIYSSVVSAPGFGAPTTSNGGESVTFNYTGSLSASNSPISIEINTQTPCTPNTSMPVTTISFQGSPYNGCSPTITTSLTLATPALNATLLGSNILNENTGYIGDLCFELQNTSTAGTIPQEFVAFTPDPSTNILGYAVTSYTTAPSSYGNVPTNNQGTISTPLLPGSITYVHFQYKVINTNGGCAKGGGTYTFSYGLNPPWATSASAQCQSTTINTSIQSDAGVPGVVETPNIPQTNSVFCSSSGSNTMPVSFVFTNNGTPLTGADAPSAGNAKSTHLQLLIQASNDMGSIDPTTFAINGVPIPQTVTVGATTYTIVSSQTPSNLTVPPFNLPVNINSTRFDGYFIDLTQLPASWGGGAPFGTNTLQDIDGDGYVDDLSEVIGSNTFTLTATFMYASNPPTAEFSECGADKGESMPAVTAYYLDQCLNIPAFPWGDHTSYFYQSMQGGGTALTAPSDIQGSFDITVNATYGQSWSPSNPNDRAISFPVGSSPVIVPVSSSVSTTAEAPYGFDFNCPNGYHNMHIDLPYGFTLNTSGLQSDATHTGYLLPSFPIMVPNSPSYPTYTITPDVTINACTASSPPSLDINFGRLPMYNVYGWNTYPIPSFNVPIQANCTGDACVSSLNGTASFDFTFQYVCGGGNYPNTADDLSCASGQTYTHCPGACGTPTPFQTQSPFTFLRTNLGYINSNTYNNCNNDPYTTPSDIVPNTSIINLSAAYPGDQIEAKVGGTFSGANPADYSSMFLQIHYEPFANICGDPYCYAFDLDPTQYSTVTITGYTGTPNLNGTYTLTTNDAGYASLYKAGDGNDNQSGNDFQNVGGGAYAGASTSPVGMCFLLPSALTSQFPNANVSFNAAFDLHLVAKTSPQPNGSGTGGFYANGQNILHALRADFMGVTSSLNTVFKPTGAGDTVHSCDSWGADFTMLQPGAGINMGGYSGSNSCGQYTFYIGFGDGDVLSGTGQTDFPNEFRAYATLDNNVSFTLPPGWEYVNSSFLLVQSSTISSDDNGYDGYVATNKAYTINPTYIGTPSASGQEITFNGLNAGFPTASDPVINCWPLCDFKTSLNYDDYLILITAQPFCSLPAENIVGPSSVEPITFTSLSYTQAIQQANSALASYQVTSDYVKNPPPWGFDRYVLGHVTPVFSVNPQSSVDVKTNTFKYDISICETAGYEAPYMWLTVSDPNNYFTITGATLNSNPVSIGTLSGNTLIDVGDIQGHTCYTLEVTASVNTSVCSQFNGSNPLTYNDVVVNWGNDCTGFPQSQTANPLEPVCQMPGSEPISFTIYPSTLNLLPPPAGSGLQEYPNPNNPVDLCNGQLTYNFIIEDPYEGTVGSPAFWMTLPNGITVSSATFTYPLGTSNTIPAGAPTSINGGEGWYFNTLPTFTSTATPDPIQGNGLPGYVSSTSTNNQVGVSVTLNTSCGYDPNQSIGFYVGGNNICNQTLTIPPNFNLPPINNVSLADNLSVSITSSSANLGCTGSDVVTVTVTNNSTTNSNVNNDLVTVTLPSTVSASNFSSSGGTQSGSTITWGIAQGSIAPSKSATYTFNVSMSNIPTCQNITIPVALTYSQTIACSAGSCTVTSTLGNSPSLVLINTCPNSFSLVGITSTNITCNGVTNGSATVTVSGSVSPYTYTWSPSGGNAATASGLGAGTYIVTVKDNCGNSVTATATITTPSAVSITKTTTTASCAASNTGTATVTPTGGISPYTYTWASSGGNAATATGLGAGTYTITVKDNCGNSASATAVVTAPAALTITKTTATASCANTNTGTASVSISGGTAQYSYLWSPRGGNLATATGLGAGTYTVTVEDKCGSSASATAVVINPAALAIKVSATESCSQSPTGTASVTSTTGGILPYTYTWANGAGNTAKISNLSAGTYTVTVEDKCGSSESASVIVSNPTALAIKVSATESCSQSPTGTASVTSTTGGILPYTYTWANGAGNTAKISNLSAGTYTVTVEDNCGSSKSASVIVSNPAVLGFKVTSTISCTQNPTGTATVTTTTGGEAPYTYTWAHGAGNTAKISNLPVGTYSITVSDKCGSSESSSIIVSAPAALSIKKTVTNVSCNGYANGEIAASGIGGIAPYTYTWMTGGQKTATISNLPVGTYTVTIEDMCTSTYSTTVTITQPAPTFTATVTDPLCNDYKTGTATAKTNGGQYLYSWSTGATTSSISSLGAGTYTVGVTSVVTSTSGLSGIGCIETATVTITQPAAITFTNTVVSNVSCNGGSTGSVSIAINGGTPVYTYSWDGGAKSTTTSIVGKTNLKAGTYTLTVIDKNGCDAIDSISITQPTALKANVSLVCQPESEILVATGIVTAGGGTSPYTYAWSGGGTNSSKANLAFGSLYSVTITDANKCTITESGLQDKLCIGIVDLAPTKHSDASGRDTNCCPPNADSLRSIILYPDPNNGEFNISGLEIGERLELYNALGQLLNTYTVTASIMKFHIENEPNGLYLMLIISSKDGTIVKRLKLAKEQ